MNRTRFQSLLAWCLSCCFAGAALMVPAQSQSPGPNPNPSAAVAVPPDAQAKPQPDVQPPPASDHWADWFRFQKVTKDDDWTRHFRIGAVAGLNIKASFSMNGAFPVNQGAGVYDDGYLHVDSTGDVDGATTYWGYDNPSQYNGQTLVMHNTTQFATSGSSEQSGSVFPGFDMAYGGNFFYLGRARIGWELGFSLMPINITDNSPMSVTSISQTKYTFNNVPYLPTSPLPYQGNYSGSSWLLPDNPGYTNQTFSTSSGSVTGSHSLDVLLYTLRLGPSVYWDLNENFGLSASFGPAIGLVSGDYKYDETITATTVNGPTSAHNQGQFGVTDVVYGGYVNALVMYHVPSENADIYVGAQYMPMGSATFSSGGREAQLKLGGQVYISAGINWAF
jgi:hypothetical protein